jgi:hypothetical protein
LIYPLWIVGFLLYCECVHRSRPLEQRPVLAVYLLFGMFRTIWLASASLSGSPWVYWDSYWMFQAIGYLLCSLLGLSLLKTITKDPRWLIDLQAIACIVVALPFISCIWEQSWHPWMAVAKWCDLAIICLLAYGLFHVEHWEPVNEGLAWGLAAGVCGHVACALVQGDQNPAEWLRWLYQLAGILQLSIWAWTLSRPKPPQIVELLAI